MRTERLCLVVLLLAALVGGAGCARRSSPQEVAAWKAEITALEAHQDSMRTYAATLIYKDPRLQKLPDGDVVISVPTSFLRNVIERVFADVADNATLSLGGIKARVAKKVKKIITIGEFVVDVDIEEVVARLEPGQPKIDFGDNVVAMSLPVKVSKGNGRATVHFVWNGKNVADLACGDMDITRRLTADVIPKTYAVRGRLKVSIDGGQIVCKPVFPETRVRVHVRPSKASWAAIDSILAEKHGVCGFVLDKVNVPGLLESIVQEKGFNIKLPVNKIRPFIIPGGVSDSLTVDGRVVAVQTQLNSINLDRDAIWYSASVTMTSR